MFCDRTNINNFKYYTLVGVLKSDAEANYKITRDECREKSYNNDGVIEASRLSQHHDDRKTSAVKTMLFSS